MHVAQAGKWLFFVAAQGSQLVMASVWGSLLQAGRWLIYGAGWRRVLSGSGLRAPGRCGPSLWPCAGGLLRMVLAVRSGFALPSLVAAVVPPRREVLVLGGRAC